MTRAYWPLKLTLSRPYRGSEYTPGQRPTISVTAGLHFIPGNRTPYFSVTGEIRRGGASDIDRGGCIHEDILHYWPELAPVVALHSSDENGVPMHAEENGWYWLAGAFGGLGERYHGGLEAPPKCDLCQQYMGLQEEDADGPCLWWTCFCKGGHYKPVSGEPVEECYVILAKHMRVPIEDMKIIADRVINFPGGSARMRWNLVIDAARPRWAREAAEAKALLVELGAIVGEI
jgi:hypothetical protein